MFFTIEKFQKRVEELGIKRYVGCRSIAPFISMPDHALDDEVHLVPPERIEGRPLELNDIFKGRDSYLWLEKKVQIPETKEGCKAVGLFDFGKTGDCYNSGFESLLYIDGIPYQGVDTNHREVLFDKLEGRIVKLTFMLWSGLEGGGIHRDFYHRVKEASLGYLHEKTDELYYYGKAITETLLLLSPDDEEYIELKSLFENVLSCIEWDEEFFYGTIETAHSVLAGGLKQLEKHSKVNINVVGYTHIDVAWLWRTKHTREKVIRSFTTALRMMEQYEEFTFLQTQPQLYNYIKQDRPDLYEIIKEKIEEGRWEPDGGMWVEADCNLPSGESLVRQFLYGIRFIKQEFGKECKYLWLPDVFGYSWALPQILKQCRIDTFMTTKISWNQFNTMPDDVFWWRGIDGSEILTYFVNTPEEGRELDTRYSTYSGMMDPRTVAGSWKKFRNKNLSKNTLISYGYGDGGGGVTRDMLEMRRAMDKLPGLPGVKPVRALDFFNQLHEDIENSDEYVHTWDGELYLEYHRGTYTSQAYNKKVNRYMEQRLTQAEWLASVCYAGGGEYPRQEIEDCWREVLLQQFHDIIPGSSIREVYEDSRISYERAEKLADGIIENAFKKLIVPKENCFGIYTVNSFGGKELVHVPVIQDGDFIDAAGKKLEAQRTAKGYEVLMEIQPFSMCNITFRPGKDKTQEQKSAFKLNRNSIETPYYVIEWNEAGQLVKIFDKEADRMVIREGEKGNVLEIYEDKPLKYDAWDIDIFHVKKKEIIEQCKGGQVVEEGPLKAVIRFEYSFHKSQIVQDMAVYRDSRRIDFTTHVDWQEDHKLLKTAFYTNIRAVKATYDIQFGHVERPTHWNTSWDWARFEVCGHKWADISEEDYGVALLNDSKYGYSIKDHVMRLSLLKSAKFPDTSADMGEHDFVYSFLPHTGRAQEGGVIEAANNLNLPAQAVSGEFKDKNQLVKVSDDGVQIDAVKKAEDEECLIVRLHECRGGRHKVQLSSGYNIQKIVPCNLLEESNGEEEGNGELEFVIKPFEIMSLKLYLDLERGYPYETFPN